MKFQRTATGILEIGEAARSHLLAQRQLHADTPESGGILLGRLIAGTNDIVIDSAIGPTDADRRTRFSFFRPRRRAQEFVTCAWHQSRQTLNYVGEWHTHPENDPRPSCIDRRDWAKVVRRATFEQDALFFVIVGRAIVRVWEFSKQAESPTALQPL